MKAPKHTDWKGIQHVRYCEGRKTREPGKKSWNQGPAPTNYSNVMLISKCFAPERNRRIQSFFVQMENNEQIIVFISLFYFANNPNKITTICRQYRLLPWTKLHVTYTRGNKKVLIIYNIHTTVVLYIITIISYCMVDYRIKVAVTLTVTWQPLKDLYKT